MIWKKRITTTNNEKKNIIQPIGCAIQIRLFVSAQVQQDGVGNGLEVFTILPVLVVYIPFVGILCLSTKFYS